MDPFVPSAERLLEFLTGEFERGLAYSTLNCARSAIALITGPALQTDPLVQRFFRGIANIRPPGPKYNLTWDPQLVLKYFQDQPPTDRLTIEALAKKLVTLLALTTGHRLQTLAKIRLPNIKASPTQINIFIPDRIKTSCPGRTQPMLVLPFYSDPQICAAKTLQRYLAITASSRGNIDYLFLSLNLPLHPVTTQTLSRWVKAILQESGINSNFTAHSARHASTSAALRGGASADSILKAAGWTASSTVFATFYSRPLVDEAGDFAHAVLRRSKEL